MTDACAPDQVMPPGDAMAGRPRAAPLELTYEPAFDWLSPAYRDLFADADATAFQHPLWLDAFGCELAPARGARLGALVGRQDGRLRLVAPLILRRRRGLRLLEAADLGVGDYAAPVLDPDWSPAPEDGQGGLAARAARLLPAHDILRIRPVRPEHVGPWRLLFDAGAEPLGFGAHAAALPSSHDAWREGALSPAFRRTIERKAKRFARMDGARLRLVSSPDEIADAIALIAELRAGRFAGDMIAQDAVRRFYQAAAVAGAASGFARTHLLEAEGRPLAALFGLAHRGRHNYLLLGCDYERDGRLSPGYVAYDALIRDFIAEGGTCFDFTIGDEPFKAHFGTEATPMYGLVRAATLRGRLALAARRLGGALSAARTRKSDRTKEADHDGAP